MTQEHAIGTDSHYDIVVVGGGLAGLVAGLTAAEGGARVAVVEAQGLGGRAKTTERDGYSYNVGPHALYLAGHLHPFLKARGLAPAGGPPSTTFTRVLRDGRLWPFGFTALDLARTKLLSARSRVHILALLAKLPRLDAERFVGVTWQDWLGNEPDDVADLLRMLGRVSTYVNAPATFDAGAALIQLQAALKGVLYIDGGWHTMVRSLSAAFTQRGGTVVANTPVLSVDTTAGRVETPSGAIGARAVVLAGLGPDAAARLVGRPAADIDGRDRIGGPVHASALDLALDRVKDGVVFGIDQPLYLSAHAPAAKLAPAGAGLVSLMRYIPDGEANSATTDRAELGALAAMAGIERDMIVHERFLHRLVVASGFPTASGGGLRGRPGVNALGVDGVFLAGDWVGPSGQLTDAASASAEAAALAALSHVGGRARVACLTPARAATPGRRSSSAASGRGSSVSPTGCWGRSPTPRMSSRSPGSAGSGQTTPRCSTRRRG